MTGKMGTRNNEPVHSAAKDEERGAWIRVCTGEDVPALYEIINDAAEAYRGIIPPDRWKDPYMDTDEIRAEIRDGVVFYGYEDGGGLKGVMGLQDRGDVFLIRHAYVRTACRRKGIGAGLLKHLEGLVPFLNQDGIDASADRNDAAIRPGTARKPVLMGTWKDAAWAVDFYEKHGYTLVDTEEKNRLLRKYWAIPARQVETSVVLADRSWFASGRESS